MNTQQLKTLRAVALTSALALPAAATAQATWTYSDWDNDGNLEVSDQEFQTGFAETGTYNAWDSDETVGLSEGEFATGVYSSWDTDNDLQLTEQEYMTGTQNWYGDEYNTAFSDWDTDTSGYIDTNEFGAGWDNTLYSDYDTDSDALLTEDEFNTGVYSSADLDQNEVITVEEEGWFEGWFDGDDVEAEIEQVGDVI